MLVIFDLDDTLIQTSQIITPWRFQRVLSYLEMRKVLSAPLESHLQFFIQQHQAYETSQAALEAFFEKEQIAHEHTLACKQILNSFDEQLPVVVFEGVYGLLKSLKLKTKLACVTFGLQAVQQLKLKKAALDKLYFDDIAIVEEGGKEEAYKAVFSKHNPSCVLVVGDRVGKDLMPAKNLGFYTALVQQGRGRFQKINKDYVDFVIGDVAEVENLLEYLKNTRG